MRQLVDRCRGDAIIAVIPADEQPESAGASSAVATTAPGVCDLYLRFDGYTQGRGRTAGRCSEPGGSTGEAVCLDFRVACIAARFGELRCSGDGSVDGLGTGRGVGGSESWSNRGRAAGGAVAKRTGKPCVDPSYSSGKFRGGTSGSTAHLGSRWRGMLSRACG